MGGPHVKLELFALELSKPFVNFLYSGIQDLHNYLSDWVDIFRNKKGGQEFCGFKVSKQSNNFEEKWRILGKQHHRCVLWSCENKMLSKVS